MWIDHLTDKTNLEHTVAIARILGQSKKITALAQTALDRPELQDELWNEIVEEVAQLRSNLETKSQMQKRKESLMKRSNQNR